MDHIDIDLREVHITTYYISTLIKITITKDLIVRSNSNFSK